MPTWQFYVNVVRPNGEAFALHQHAFGGMGGRPGGGGHGDPARCRRERIEADLEAGYVTSEVVRRDYGYK